MTVSEKVILDCKKAYLANVPVIYLLTEQLDLLEDIIDSQIIPFYSDNGKFVERKSATNIIFDVKRSFMSSKPSKRFPRLGIIKNFHSAAQDYGNIIFNFIDMHSRADKNSFIKKSLLILNSPILRIPEGLESYVEVIKVGHLNVLEIKQIIKEFCYKEMLTDVYVNKLTEAFKGFSKRQIIDTLKRVKIEYGSVINAEATFKEIYTQKKQVLEKSGTLSMIEPEEVAVGGLRDLIHWLETKRIVLDNLTEATTKWKLMFSKGVLISGLPGTGKTLMAKKTAEILGIPLIKMDMGALMGRYLGESEENMQKAQKMAEALAPCVLWIDELEKSFAGVGSSNDNNDSVRRCFSSFLTWMQEKKAPCFIFATANDITSLPSEFLRRGRFDEKFYTYMPLQEECIEIFQALMNRMNKSNDDCGNKLFDQEILKGNFLSEIVEYAGNKNKFFNGSDIQGIINDAVQNIYLERKRDTSNINHIHRNNFLIDKDEMKQMLEHVIDRTKTFGETSKKDIALYWLKTRENQFRNASGTDRVLFRFEDFDEIEGKFNSKSTYSGSYNRQLATYLKDEIEKLWANMEGRKGIKGLNKYE